MRIAITGATGFVGGRLAERLALDGDHEALAIVRRFTGPGLARLARLAVPMSQAELTDRDGLEQALTGCDAVVHCAYGTSGTPEERHDTTVRGTATVLSAAQAAGVERVVHLSSTVVHGLPLEGTITESSPLADAATPYDRMKRAAEDEVWAFHSEHGFPIVVLRPPLIYGPHGRRWTERIVREIQQGAVLVDGGEGAANFLHVDNLVDAILLAAMGEVGAGEAFLLVDDHPATWRDVYEGYAALLSGAPPLRALSRAEVERLRRQAEPGLLRASTVLPLKLAPVLAKQAVASRETRKELRKVPWVDWMATATRGLRQKREGSAPPQSDGTGAPDYPLPDPGLTDLMTCRGRYSADRARSRLGWEPRVSFDQALAILGEWLEYQRLT
jgi:nucleoside-diphosphate-sugar epimerase